MTLDALEDFVAVIEAGSFTAAARATRKPKSTLSKRVQDLEMSLGLRLIERTTRKLRPTPDGTFLLERARRLIADADDLERLMRERDEAPRGRLRVSAPVLFGHAFMGRIATAYLRRWAETTIEVTFTDRRVDLIEEDLDCAIRVGRLEDSSLIARRFAQSPSLLVAGVDLVKALGHPSSPSDLADWPSISFGFAGPEKPWALCRGVERTKFLPKSALVLGSIHAMRDAARLGAGVALIPDFFVATDISSGVLEHVLPDWCGESMDLSIVYPSGRHLSARVRAFIEIVTANFPDRELGGSVSA